MMKKLKEKWQNTKKSKKQTLITCLAVVVICIAGGVTYANLSKQVATDGTTVAKADETKKDTSSAKSKTDATVKDTDKKSSETEVAKKDSDKSDSKSDSKTDDKKDSNKTDAKKDAATSTTSKDTTTKKTSSSSTSSSSSSSSNSGSSSSGTSGKKTHVVNHPATGHNEQYVITEAYDETVQVGQPRTWSCCNVCGADITGHEAEHAEMHMLRGEGCGHHTEYDYSTVSTKTIHHDAVYGTRWVEDSPAWSETVED